MANVLRLSNSEQRDSSTFSLREIHSSLFCCVIKRQGDQFRTEWLQHLPHHFCKLNRVNKLIQRHNAHGNQFSTSKAQTMHCCCCCYYSMRNCVIVEYDRLIRFPNLWSEFFFLSFFCFCLFVQCRISMKLQELQIRF